VPWIINNGGQAYLEVGKPNNGGTKIFSVVGDVEKPGNFEVPMGTPFSKLLELAGGVRKGRKLKAVIPGGSSVPVFSADEIDVPMDFDSVAKAGSLLGSAGIIVMDDTTCMVRTLEVIARFYHHESCGQCTPCREGTGWLHKVLRHLEEGTGREEDLQLLIDISNNMMGNTVCVLADAAAMPTISFVKKFGEEFAEHVKLGRCPLRPQDAPPLRAAAGH